MGTPMPCHHQHPKVLLQGGTALTAAFELPLYHRQGMLRTTGPCLSEMHLPLSTVLAYPFSLLSHVLPLRLRLQSPLASLRSFTQQVCRGLGLAELIWGQCLVPRSHVYGRNAFLGKVNEQDPAQRCSKGQCSSLDTLLAANSSQLASFHKAKRSCAS